MTAALLAFALLAMQQSETGQQPSPVELKKLELMVERVFDGKVVEKGNRIYPLVAKRQAEIEKAYEKGGSVFADFSKWVHIESPAAARLFPNLQFAAAGWSMRANPDSKQRISIAGGLATTVVIDRNENKFVGELYNWGNHDEFGKLLVDHQIKLRNDKDAGLVWDAFCELHLNGSKTRPRRQISEREWRLGISSYDQIVATDEQFRTIVTRTHYSKLIVEPGSGRILAWKSTVETTNNRKVAIEQPRRGAGK